MSEVWVLTASDAVHGAEPLAVLDKPDLSTAVRIVNEKYAVPYGLDQLDPDGPLEYSMGDRIYIHAPRYVITLWRFEVTGA